MQKVAYHVILAAGAVLAIASNGSASSRTPPARELTTAAQVDSAAARTLYLKNCRQCHGATGEPSSETKNKYPKIKSLNDSAFLASMPDDSILTVIRKGAGKDMKSFGDRLTKEEMAGVLKYVRTLPFRKSK